MTDNDAWSLQVSPKLPDGTLVNIRANNALDLKKGLEDVRLVAGDIAETVALLHGTKTLASAGVTGEVQQPAPVSPEVAPSNVTPINQQAGQPPAPSCIHGQKQFKSSAPGAGREWSAWFCPSPKGTPGQCSPVDAVTGKEWSKK